MRTGFLITLVALAIFGCTQKTQQLTIQSPDQSISVTAWQEGTATKYSINKNEMSVLEASTLGLVFENTSEFDELQWAGVSELGLVETSYTLYQGKRSDNTYKANSATIFLKNKSGKRLNVVFQVSDDGVGFKYVFPDALSDTIKISNELTSFNFTDSARAWLQPMSVAKTGWSRTNPSYEENYFVDVPVGTQSPTDAGWIYPALFKTNNTWALITESGLKTNYCATRLGQNSENGEYHIAFPPAEEGIFDGPVRPESTLPWETPWRVVAIGSLQTIIESNLGNALADPAIELDDSFIKTGLSSWSWAILKDESITYDIQKQFIDFASDMNWQYCLVDVNWDTTIGYDKMAELSAYAAEKEVGLILWYNSAGDWNDVTYHPKDKMLTSESRNAEFGRLKEMGIKGIKVDFFGGDGQSVIAYYHDIFKDAAKYGLLVNCHGATLPRGWHRTYPNLMTMESIKGFEFITFEQGNADLAPEHCAILPFTRNAFDPMDFTPMNLTSIPNIDRKTSPAFELALPVLFLSGIQHIAETPAGIAQVPDYVKEYLKDIPTDWDDTRFLDGYPGEYVVLARLKNDTWHIVGINATNEKIKLNLDLSFINQKNGFLITDGEDAGFSYKEMLSDAEKEFELAPKGGIVMKF